MEIARTLREGHPEVLMFQRRCLGDAETLYTKAKELIGAGDDGRAVKVRSSRFVSYVLFF